MSFPASDIQWSKNLWDSIKTGGIWGIPRSGLIMVKTETGFDLQSLAPLTEHGMPCDWAQFQRQDFCAIGERFAAAGLTFTDSRNLLECAPPAIVTDNEICGGCGAHFETEAHAIGCVNAGGAK